MSSQERGKPRPDALRADAPRSDHSKSLIQHPAMALIGAAGQDSGKTLLATALIERVAATTPIAAAKVTTVQGDRGRCPRGGEGCGVCSSLEEPYRLTREEGLLVGKDTTRMLDAGAEPVYWLCVHEDYLQAGAVELVKALGGPSPAICESNSLRTVVDPGLFIVVQREGSTQIKRSCRAVWEQADVVVRFDGERFSPGIEAFRWSNGRWSVKRQATAVVLAGGKSNRMGRDKTLLPFAGKTLIEHVVDQLEPHFDELLVSANDREKYQFLGLPVIQDRLEGQGPMMAIASALERARHPMVFVVAADVPMIRRRVLTKLLRLARAGGDVVVPVTPEGHFEPLFAVYDRRIKAKLDAALDRGERQIFALYDKLETVTLPLTRREEIVNLNTITEYEKHIERMK